MSTATLEPKPNAATKPSTNGVFKITKRSVREFQFDEADPPIGLDIIEVADMWHEVNWALRTKKVDEESGKDVWVVPPEKTNEHAANRQAFVQRLVNTGYEALVMANKISREKLPPVVDRGMAEEFVVAVLAEVEQLRNFIYPRDAETLSAPGNTEEPPPEGVNFSQ